jgi:hypothetical protein
VGQLELLLVFFNNKNRSWTVPQLSQELRSHDTIVKIHTQKLIAHGFVKEVDGKFTYAPAVDLNHKVEQLCESYKDMSVAVIAFIYEKPTDKLKGFADAFKLKKD